MGALKRNGGQKEELKVEKRQRTRESGGRDGRERERDHERNE